MKRAILTVMLVFTLGCEGPKAHTPKSTAVVEPINDPPATEEAESESLGLVETPQARAIVLGASLPPEPTRTKMLEGVSSEGAIARIWEKNGERVKVELEFKGETYDRVNTVYFEHGKPFFARFYEHFDPAKMLEKGDEGYDEGVAARYIEVFLVDYVAGEITKVETAKIQTREGATYDGGNLVRVRVLETQPIAKTDNGFNDIHSSNHELLSQL